MLMLTEIVALSHPLHPCAHCEDVLCSWECPGWLAEAGRCYKCRLDTSLFRSTPLYHLIMNYTSVTWLISAYVCNYICCPCREMTQQQNGYPSTSCLISIGHLGFSLLHQCTMEFSVTSCVDSVCALAILVLVFQLQVFLLQCFQQRANFMPLRYSKLL